jgi:hypothetical protein
LGNGFTKSTQSNRRYQQNSRDLSRDMGRDLK